MSITIGKRKWPSVRLVKYLLGMLITAGLIIAGSCTYTSDQPDLKDRDIRVTFLHTTDIHSRIFPFDHDPMYTELKLGMREGEDMNYGGIARMATVIKEQRQKAGRVLHLDSGDLFQGAPIFNVFHGEPEVKAMTEMGLDVFVLGNHEFDAGPQNVIDQFENYAGFQVLCANYRFENHIKPHTEGFQTLVQPYTMFDLQGVKVGVIGMSNLSSITSLENGGNSMGVVPLDTIQTVQDYVNVLREQVDLVVLLSHLGLGTDEYVAQNVCGLDVIIGGHHHVALLPPKVIPYDPHKEVVDNIEGIGECSPSQRRDALMVHSQAFSKFVGRLDMVLYNGKIKAHKYELFPVDSTIKEDPDMVYLLEPYYEQMLRVYDLDRVIAHALIDLRRFGSTGGDSMMGNMVAEAMQFRRGVETDFAVTNSLGIRTDIQVKEDGVPHPITLETMFNIMPFENTITTMYMSGMEIQEMLDFATRKSSSRGCTSQIQVSNMSFDMNCTTGKAENIVIAGSPMKLDSIYEMATNNYIAWGGSGFDVLKRNTTKIDTGIALRDAVIDFMREHPELPVCYEEEPSGLTDEEVADWLAGCADGIAVEDGRIRTIF